jgi:hypothetical protein
MPRESTLGGRNGTKIGAGKRQSTQIARYHTFAYDNVSVKCGVERKSAAAQSVAGKLLSPEIFVSGGGVVARHDRRRPSGSKADDLLLRNAVDDFQWIDRSGNRCLHDETKCDSPMLCRLALPIMLTHVALLALRAPATLVIAQKFQENGGAVLRVGHSSRR